MSDRRYLKLNEVADLLGVKLSLIYRWSSEDPTFPKTKFGARTVRVAEDKLQLWIEKQTVGAAE